MTWLVHILADALKVGAGALACYLLLWWKERNSRKVKQLEAEAILTKARADAELLLRDARLAAADEAARLRQEAELSFASRRAERAELERRLAERESLINSQLTRILEAEKRMAEQTAGLETRAADLKEQQDRVAELQREARHLLERLSGLTESEAKHTFLKNVEQNAVSDANALTRQILDQAKAQAEDKARQIITTAIQRYAGEHTFQTTTASISLQGEDIKGRIIGREGRNIRAFEAATGVTVLIDDTPGSVLLSGFDPVRREIAKEAMLRLIQDGRIHPTRIEEIVAQVSHEMEETIVHLGEDAVRKAGLPPMHPETVKLLGRLHFRHSYSQNILDHSVEVAHLMGLMAAELGLDVTAARKAGLLHDIGKAVHHEVEGPHALAGAEIVKRQGECDEVVNAIASHHNDVPSNGPLGILVSAADAISASRPGARSENMATYLKRVEDLERIANSFPGVEKAFAVQAGRELRVFVKPEYVDDEQAYALARNIASQTENELQYPGQIKVIVIRETRCLEFAK